jgi:hypothetical protein
MISPCDEIRNSKFETRHHFQVSIFEFRRFPHPPPPGVAISRTLPRGALKATLPGSLRFRPFTVN